MLSAKTRGLLDRYALASRSLSQQTGERSATEAGQSVEFHDYRAYQAGDELRYVDWKVYARTGRLYTRLYQAERTVAVHIVLDTSKSMTLGHKQGFANAIAGLLSYVAQRDSRAQVHLFNGLQNKASKGRAGIPATWKFIQEAEALEEAMPPATALKDFALNSKFSAGAGLALIISDLFDEEPLQSALAALKARGLDASFLHIVAPEDLEPETGQLDILDIETGERLQVGPQEVRAYHQAVQQFLSRTRNAILQAGFRHLLIKSTADTELIEQTAFTSLIKAGILIRR